VNAEGRIVPAAKAEWSAEEFILRGRYCSRPAIRDRLEAARVAVGAEAALLIAVDETALLRSLCLQVPPVRDTPHDLVGMLRSRKHLNHKVDFPALALNSPRAGEDRPPFPRSTPQLLAVLAKLAEDGKRPELAVWLHDPARWVAIAATPAAAARISAAILFRDPNPTLVNREEGVAVLELSEELVELTKCVNATAQADVRRDTAIMARLEEELDPEDYAGEEVDLARAAATLVRLAIQISGSDIGACYLFDHGAKALQLVASGSEEPDRDGYPETLPAEKRALASSSFRRRRPIQLPPGLPDDAEVTPTAALRSVEGLIELATPIVGPLASPRSPAVGVLSVARLAPDAEPYGSYELALLRNVGLRLSLIKAAANTEAAAAIFAQLSSGAKERIREESGKAGPLRGLRIAERSLAPGGAPVPDDLKVTLPAIQAGLETLGRVTGSHSATFRAALPSEIESGPHGLTLRRLAAYPRHWLEAPGELQSEKRRGINWEVALGGIPKYAPSARDEDGYLEQREETLSELCVPVSVEGRVIGVVNLESDSHSAYDAQVTTVQAFAAHVGLAIADARIAIASILHDYAIEVVRRGHELGGECKELRALADEADAGGWRKELLVYADLIERKAKGLREFGPEEEAAEAACLWELVEAEKARIQLEFADLKVDPGLSWVRYPPGIAQLVELALRDILGNVKRHADKGRGGAQLLVHRGIWGGELHDILTVVDRPSAALSDEDAVNAFRSLLGHESPDPERTGATRRVPQFGAYLAGTLARRAGGDVHLCQRRDGLTQVKLSIPANPKNPDRRGSR
jgi:hypothetical protein